MPPASDFLRLIQLARRGTRKGQYVSVSLPERMGGVFGAAFGGCVMSMSLNAAHLSLPEDREMRASLRVYSMLGHYLGPTLTDRHVSFSCEVLRETRTFATQLVRASQVMDNGSERACFAATVDFMRQDERPEPGSSREPFERYSPAPARHYPRPEEVPEWTAVMGEQQQRQPGGLSERQRQYLHSLTLWNRVGISREIAGTMHYASLAEAAPPPDSPLATRISADWFCAREDLTAAAEAAQVEDKGLATTAAAANACFLAFTLDASVAFVPLTFSGLSLADASACASLDFALRFLDPAPDMHRYHLREMNTSAGYANRTLGSARCWDREGALVAEMSQMSILRPRVEQARL